MSEQPVYQQQFEPGPTGNEWNDMPNSEVLPPAPPSPELFGNYLDYLSEDNANHESDRVAREAMQTTINALRSTTEAALVQDSQVDLADVVAARIAQLSRVSTPQSELGQKTLELQRRNLQNLHGLLERPDAGVIMRDAIDDWKAEKEGAERQREKGDIVNAALDRVHEAIDTGAAETASSAPVVDDSVAAARRLVDRIKVSGVRQGDLPAGQAVGSFESHTQSPIVGQVVAAAKGSAIIHMDTPGALPLIYRESPEKKVGYEGFKTFGDGADGLTSEVPQHLYETIGGRNMVKHNVNDPDGEYLRDVVEAVAFVPAAEDLYEDQTELVKGGFMRPSKEVRRRVKTGERRVMVTNPATGEQEPGVYFDYAYSPGLAGDPANTEKRLGLPPYRESLGGRAGSRLIVRTLIPERLAAELRKAITRDPQVARQIVEKAVLELGGMPEEAWRNGADLPGGRHSNRLTPPYDGLPSTHRLFIMEPQVDAYGRQIMVGHKIDRPV